MVSEKRLIDANDFIKHFWERVHGGEIVTLMDAEHAIINATTVYAVEVVRCGECASHEKEACPKGTVWCKTMCRYMKPDGFCSEGRKSVEG